jgi:exopolysaccharide production protein ExoZ
MERSKNQGIQAARAIAALTVAYFHSYIALRGFPESAQWPIAALKQWGYLGVDFFFAISGYVICLIAAKPHFSSLGFSIKRVFRLFPMYWVVMGVVGLLILAHLYRAESLSHFLYSISLLPQQHASVYDPSWTLEREIVFYGIAAVVVPFAGIWGLAIALAALALGGWYLGDPWTYHLVSTRQADFLAGVLVFLIGDDKRFGPIVAIVGAVILAITRTYDFTFSIPLCMGCILFGMVELRLPWQRWPFQWLVQIGDASYSLYLLHVLIFTAVSYVAVHFVTLPDSLCEPYRYVTLALCCTISCWTWRLIELPAIKYGNGLASRIRRPNASNNAHNVVANDGRLHDGQSSGV